MVQHLGHKCRPPPPPGDVVLCLCLSYLKKVAVYAPSANDTQNPQNKRLLRRKTTKKSCDATLHGFGDGTSQRLKYIHVFLKPASKDTVGRVDKFRTSKFCSCR